MVYFLDQEINLTRPACFYTISSQHRYVRPKEKSKWTVTYEEEVNIFRNSYSEKWLEGYICWGLLLNGDNIILQLGINKFNENLFISKFIDGNKNSKWHGYPADYKRNLYDRPSVRILSLWKDSGKIEKHHISKIRCGKKCNL